ncbi:Mov34/MPN/PAD-1 family protein [Fibrella forsythiae]|uniref:Mov34/MPN/PAD-1 family protein n=1 Tax=Fibrella forsythiae TaxID=2817061 RepID=A0ABS3JMG2_9BACT|nr:Mov34/MPN/PAD-1 family protein [Fibrella forsythiae]MBO0951180.1 Mov34/MPN/PAD-1 family protein [Fibrella forsythiae]
MKSINPAFLLFQIPGGGRLKISDQALDKMLSFRQLNLEDCEAGGVMLGRLLIDSNDVVIDEVTVPMCQDKRSRFAFYRHKRGHQAVINQRWHSSNGTCIYLGEWHTHPEPVPTPSTTDRNDWRRKLRADRFEKSLFFVIVGTHETKMWVGEKQCQLVQHMENITPDT